MDWQAYGRTAAKAIKESGLPAEVVISVEDPDQYDIAAGKPFMIIQKHPTDAITKNFTIEDHGFADPESVEITFHSGIEPDTMPDLLQQSRVQLYMSGKVYKVTKLQAVRPAGVTMLYKGKAKESRVQ